LAIRHNLERRRQALTGTVRALDTVSPLATLSRGYAIVRDPLDKSILRSAKGIKPGDSIETLLGEGRLICEVNAIYTNVIASNK
jgi:exodeoxyribonuclease VII large subunit